MGIEVAVDTGRLRSIKNQSDSLEWSIGLFVKPSMVLRPVPSMRLHIGTVMLRTIAPITAVGDQLGKSSG
jgi:hypothetical protein